MIEVGEQIPEFSLPSTQCETLSKADLKGSWAILYFYPKDNTPGCTKPLTLPISMQSLKSLDARSSAGIITR